MKDNKKRIGRAIVLLLLSDRCALEKEVIGGVKYSIAERECQRGKIYRWLVENGYNLFASKDEMLIFEQSVSVSSDLSGYQVVHEGLEPILWSLGLIKKLSSYDSYVLSDFHPILEIGKFHNIDNIVKKINPLTEKEIEIQKDVSLLWNWRSRMGKNEIFLEKNAEDIIIDTFGHEFGKALKKIDFAKESPKDFKVNLKPFNQLTDNELLPIKELALWRHHSFEWMLSSKEWQDVETNT